MFPQRSHIVLATDFRCILQSGNMTRYIVMVGTHKNKSAYPVNTGNEAKSTRCILARKTYMTNNPGFKSVCVRMEGETYERKHISVV